MKYKVITTGGFFAVGYKTNKLNYFLESTATKNKKEAEQQAIIENMRDHYRKIDEYFDKLIKISDSDGYEKVKLIGSDNWCDKGDLLC